MSADHPERILIHHLLLAPDLAPLPVTTNPLALAFRMHIDACRPDHIRARFHIGPEFTQGNSVVQGGILAAMLDFGMIFAAFTRTDTGHTLATITQTTNFLRPALAGDFTVEAEVERAGRLLIHTRATLSAADGKPVATASSPIALIPLPHGN